MVALVTMVPVMAATPWQKITHPVAGSPQSIGGFANGCVIGAQPLPLESADYQVMRSDQRRYFGHPDLLNFIHRLSAQAHQQQLGTVLIGDMAMPAGGRFSSGHASHQSGLDVDIWLQLPKQRWSQQQLLKPQPIDLVAVDGKRVIPALWQPQIESLIKLAAKDNDVTRIFVNPAIKKQLCLDAGADRQWLHKVRPWFAHRAHMHVRLRCPANSLECVDQDTPPPGDGCGAELESWFQPPPPSAKPGKTLPPPLPPSCQALLDNHFATE
ncbi:penicillin-insensitive murein endopeptidase family protein [Yersinia pseudotuberculosis IP 32953]|nr:peptidoglycan amidase MepA [Yersinia pestis Angola]AJJ03449.1 penicillin-insensitive murein endopeptidase family protein [Yersinia pseudotuberculosis]AJJ56967.1 penicillin-insensitive murein endopeptidase family protein [Yersinia pseudotuberculosis IP 32953]AJJ60332.1 penicillin-insensitive murein endopeptidase family protein [Yersinia pseudotuberculosis YPIII]AJJ65993.1 penicillin-insensitive murein endopeptidase family protein [Yersinia pseudotuberculosis PB1/+]AJJ80240.1 penicillin-insen